jgi:hypothetical protein
VAIGEAEIRAGEKTVAASATPEAIVTGAVGALIRAVVIQAKLENTDSVYLGNATTQKLELVPGASIGFDVLNLNKVYLKVDVNGEGINYFGQG